MNGITSLLVVAQSDGSNAIAIIGGLFAFIIWAGLMLVVLTAMWKVFTKAGQPGWAILVPIYNIYVMTQIVGKEAWWVILFFVPLLNLVASLVIALEMARVFGKGTGFGIGLFLFPPLFYLFLGFGSAQYQGVGAGSPPRAMAA